MPRRNRFYHVYVWEAGVNKKKKQNVEFRKYGGFFKLSKVYRQWTGIARGKPHFMVFLATAKLNIKCFHRAFALWYVKLRFWGCVAAWKIVKLPLPTSAVSFVLPCGRFSRALARGRRVCKVKRKASIEATT